MGSQIITNLTSFAGRRYLDADYRNNNKLFLYNMTVSGVSLGAVFWFK